MVELVFFATVLSGGRAAELVVLPAVERLAFTSDEGRT